MEKLPTESVPGLFTVAPRFCGAPQAELSDPRCETQMSLPPWPPDRLLVKKRLNPLGEMTAAASFEVEFTIAPRFWAAVKVLSCEFAVVQSTTITRIADRIDRFDLFFMTFFLVHVSSKTGFEVITLGRSLSVSNERVVKNRGNIDESFRWGYSSPIEHR